MFINIAALLLLATPALAVGKHLRRDLQDTMPVEGGICQRQLAAIRVDQPDFDPDAACLYNPTDENENGFPDRYTGCWFDGSFREDVSGELVDEFCECYLAYEKDCMSKIPFGELPGPASNQQPIQWSQFVSSDKMSPGNFGKYCQFAGVWTADFVVEIDDEMQACGCLWIDMVEEFIDECPGVEFVQPEEEPEEDAAAPVAPVERSDDP